MKRKYLDCIRDEYLAFARRYKHVPGNYIFHMRYARYEKYVRLVRCMDRAAGGGK